MAFTQCVGITHNAFALHHPSLYPNSNYRYMIYLPPQFSPSGLLWLLISTAAILKSGKTGKMDAEKGGLHCKLALFKVWSHQAALAPGKLLETQILGPNPSLPESESLGHLGGEGGGEEEPRKLCFHQLRRCLPRQKFEKHGIKCCLLLFRILSGITWGETGCPEPTEEAFHYLPFCT